MSERGTGDPAHYRKPIELRRLGRRHAIVEASAGTGKTYILEHLIIDLLLRTGTTLDQILVVTFTEKATTELTHRVRRKLEELSELREDRAPSSATDNDADEDDWVLDAAAREKLRRALLAFDRANILTIHAFCQRILTENAFVQGRLFDEEATEERDAFHAAFAETLRHDVAADSTEAALLEAWRRGGNTIVWLERILFEVAAKLGCIYPPRAGAIRPDARYDPESLASAAASWPAFGENDDALKDILKRAGIHGNTVRWMLPRLRAVTAAVAERERGPVALLAAVERIDRGVGSKRMNDGILSSIIKDLGSAKVGHPLATELRRAALALDAAYTPLIALLANHLLPTVRARLERRKREAGLFDFQDMLTLVARNLEGDSPRARALLGALRGRYRYALVDEFQDTDETQWQIFRRLFLDAGATGVLTLVGDPKQAIYSFRGADVHTYLRAHEELAAVQEPLVLEASYRATRALITAQNALLDQRDPAPFFRADGPIQYDHPVTCGRPDRELCDARGGAVAPVVVLDVVRAPEKTGARLNFQEIKPALLDRIAREIEHLLGDEGRLALRDGETETPLGAREIFVLTRTVRESREVGETLRARRIPFAYFKQEKLFDTVEAEAVLDLLRALAEPDDRSARFRAFITGFFGLTLLDLAACDELPADHPLMQRLEDWRALGEAGQIDQLFARIIDDSGVISRELFAQGVKGRASERTITNYLHLFELLQQEVVRDPCTLRELVQRLSGYVAGTRKPPGRNADVQRLETDADTVQIMTIHHSKGLEAGIVFVYGATWPWRGGGDARMFHDEEGRRTIRVGRQPEGEEDLYTRDQEDEERRVLYVALTRARGRLYLPRYPASPICQLRGAYKFVNERLHALLGGITADEVRRLFQIESVPCPLAPAPASPANDLAAALAAWQAPTALLNAPLPHAAFHQAATARAGFIVTSYSAMRRAHQRFVPAETLDAAGDDATEAERVSALARPAPPPDELPRGRLAGSFLHEIIEHLPLDTLARAPAIDDWRALPEVAEVFERMRRRHDQQAAHLGHANRLVHTALTAPVRLGDTIVPGLGRAEHPTREMEFLYPIPETRHPGLSPAVDAPAWRIERGVVKGFIDYLFEHEGRIYVCDWKSDDLPSWTADDVTAHCEGHYTVQAELYTEAVVRLLGISDVDAFDRRFGGVVYCFLRGMRSDDATAGVYFRRPRWADVLEGQRAMLEPAYWGRP